VAFLLSAKQSTPNQHAKVRNKFRFTKKNAKNMLYNIKYVKKHFLFAIKLGDLEKM
jgi:hypothetical protein